MYAGWYGMIRFLLEFLRTDSLYIGHTGLKASQLIGLGCVIVSAGLLIYFYATKRYPKPFAAAAAPETQTTSPESAAKATQAEPEEQNEQQPK